MTALNADLLGRLGSAALLLYTLTGGARSPISVEVCAPTERERCYAYDTVTTVAECHAEEHSSLIAVARHEIKIAQEILEHAEILAGDVSFSAYLGDLDRSISIIEEAGYDSQQVGALIARLQVSRAQLENRVESLPGWLVIARAVGDDPERFVEVPERFHSQDVAFIAYEPAPSVEEIDEFFDFDDVAVS